MSNIPYEELENEFLHRYAAQVVLEATTPLKVGSGESDLEIDAPVLKNWNHLPMIQGTSIAGVLRASFDDDVQKHLFGAQYGSRILVSHAHLLNEKNEIHYDFIVKSDDPNIKENEFLSKYDDLPVREHTAINDKGVAKKGSKFDEEVVYAGSRFKFELEFLTDNSAQDKELWQSLLSTLNSPLFRLGAGSTKGFGEMKVVSCHVKEYTVGEDYDAKPGNLNVIAGEEVACSSTQKAVIYKIALKPDDFFSFGAGFGDDEVDDIAVTEEIVRWDKTEGYFSEKQILFPASSLKGALSHRVAYHYNRLNEKFADEVENIEEHIGQNNKAVHTLFGAEKGHKNEAKGKALFSDMFKTFNANEVKIFDHVKIDRFTGGAVDSALYNEKVIAQKDIWNVEIVLTKDLETDVISAFELALDDLAKGWLPLGGKVNRGHGVFISPDYVAGDENKRGWSCDKGEDNE